MKVSTPNGQVTIRRRWLPWERKVTNDMIRDTDTSDTWWMIDFDFDDPIGVIVGVFLVILLLPFILVFLLGAIEFLLLLALLPVAVVGRSLWTGWTIETHGRGLYRRERVKGWLASRRRIREIADHLARGGELAPPTGLATA